MIEYTEQTRADYTFFLPVSLRVSDVDINSHLNQSVYYEFFDTIVLHYLDQYKSTFTSDNITSFCVENGCRYRREIKFADDAVEVALRVAHIGNSSVRFEIAVFTAGHIDPNAIAYFVLVFVNKTTRLSTPIPAGLRAAMECD